LLVEQLFFILTYTKMQGVNMKVTGHSAVYVNVGLSVNLPEPARTLEDTLDNAALRELYTAPVMSHGVWFFVILGVGIWLLSFDADVEFQLLM
jgi:hypothetical protein